MNSIQLDPELGVNLTLLNCPICGHNTNNIALPGSATVWKCANSHKIIGKPKNRECPQCGDRNCCTTGVKFNGSKDRAKDTSPCDKCADILKTSNITICRQCRRMFTAECHRVLKPCEIGVDFDTTEEGVKKGFLEVVTGRWGYQNCKPSCTPSVEES